MDILSSAQHSDIATRRAVAILTATSEGLKTSKTETESHKHTENRFGNAVASVKISQAALETAKTVTAAQQGRDDHYDGILSASDREHLERIANNEDYAKIHARVSGTALPLVRISDHLIPKPGASQSDVTQDEIYYLQQLLDYHDTVLYPELKKQFDKTSAYYQSQVGASISSAQIYVNLLEYKANLGQDYWNSLFIGMNPPPRTIEHIQAQHDYLQHLLDEKAAS